MFENLTSSLILTCVNSAIHTLTLALVIHGLFMNFDAPLMTLQRGGVSGGVDCVNVDGTGNRGDGADGALALPVKKLCEKRIKHGKFNDTWYFFSWMNEATKDTKVTWFQARNICRRHCMDSVGLESALESEFIKKMLINSGKRFIWTSGRKCNFKGCERKDLQPALVNGWYWSSSGVRLPPTNETSDGRGDWSATGANNQPQPDNREYLLTGKNDEACLAVMNNFYADGVVWHDIACHYPKYFVCEDSPQLLKYANVF